MRLLSFLVIISIYVCGCKKADVFTTDPSANTSLTSDLYYSQYLAKDRNGIDRAFPSDLGSYEF